MVVDPLSWRQLMLLTGSDIICKPLICHHNTWIVQFVIVTVNFVTVIVTCVALIGFVAIIVNCVALTVFAAIMVNCVALTDFVAVIVNCVALTDFVAVIVNCVALTVFAAIMVNCVALTDFVAVIVNCVALTVFAAIIVNCVALTDFVAITVNCVAVTVNFVTVMSNFPAIIIFQYNCPKLIYLHFIYRAVSNCFLSSVKIILPFYLFYHYRKLCYHNIVNFLAIIVKFVITTVNFITWLCTSSCSVLCMGNNCNFAEHFTGQHRTLQAPFTCRLQPNPVSVKISTQTCSISRYSPQCMHVTAEKHMITLESTSRFSVVEIKFPWPFCGFSLILNSFSWTEVRALYAQMCNLKSLTGELSIHSPIVIHGQNQTVIHLLFTIAIYTEMYHTK